MTKKLKIKIEDFKRNIFGMSREEKIKVLLDYARECYKEGHKPTKRGIRKRFHVEIYNYFKNIADYHQKAGIPVSLRNYPKEEARKIITNFLQNKSKDGFHPNRAEVESALRIHITTYFKDLKELYENANVDYSVVQKENKNKILSAHTYSNNEIEKQKQLIKELIRTNVAKGFYPSVHHIQRNLNLSFYNLYNDIFEAYKETEVEYERPSPILLGRRKEEAFTKIVKELLMQMGFKILRVSIESDIDFNRYADITVEDKDGIKYLVEIKAYRKDCYISKREFKQLIRYLKEERIDRGIFITTSKIKTCQYSNIFVIGGDKIFEILNKFKLTHYNKLIQWIQNSKVNSIDRQRYKEELKNKIFEYIKHRGDVPTKKEIEKIFNVDIRSVFGRPNPYGKLLSEAEKSGALSPTA